MKSYTDLENRMKTLANEHLPTPPAAAWGNIEGALDEGKGRQGLWFLMFMGLILLGVASFAYMGNGSGYSTQISETTASNLSADIQTDLDTKNETVENNLVTAAQIEDESSQKSEQSNLSKSISQNIPSTPAIAQNDIANSITNTNTNTKTSASKAMPSMPIADNTFVLEDESPVSSNISTPSETVSSSSQLKPDTYISKANTSRSALDINGLPFKETSLDIEQKRVEYNKEIECPSFKNKSFKIYPFAEVNGILGVPNKAMSTTTAQSLLAQRNLTETNWYTWGGNAGVGLNITSWLYAGVGLEWNQSKDKFESSKNAITQVVIDYDPTTNMPIDTSFLTGLLINKGEVRYTTFDLPVYMGVTKSFGNWGVGIEGGVLMNLAFNAEGKIINESLDISRINQEAPIYKDRIGLGMRASINIRRYLNNGLSLQVKPTFKSYFNELQSDSYDINTKLSMVRLDVGIRKDF